MVTVRTATVEDAALIAEQRRRMFVDSGQADSKAMEGMVANFADWVRPRLKDGRYLGWLFEETADSSAALRNDKKAALRDGKTVVAGAGMWLMDFPPHWMDAEPVRAYLLNFYVDPEARGQGLAGKMLAMAVEEARRRGNWGGFAACFVARTAHLRAEWVCGDK
jgi:ribosomal protein S18 acetylase RimI-like enzyme